MSCKWRKVTSNSLLEAPTKVALSWTSRWNNTSTNGKEMASISLIWREPESSFCWQLVPLLPLKTQLVSVLSHPGILDRELCWMKFAAATGVTPVSGCFTPGTFKTPGTNQNKLDFWESKLLVITDPRANHQPLTEASYINLPTGKFWECKAPSPLNIHSRSCLISTFFF